jgi:quinol monooxygenase YgiN
MTAFNAVRFRVKPGREQDFINAHKNIARDWPGFLHANLIQTGERTFCIVGEWESMDALGNARAQMVATLDGLRDMLEDLGGGLGVTDPVSGPVVVKLK